MTYPVAWSAASLLRCALLCVFSVIAIAAETPDAARELPTLDEVQHQIELLQNGKSDDPQNARLLEIHQRNAQDLAAIADNRESSAHYLRLYQEVAEKVAHYTRELNELQRQARSASGLAQGVAVQRLESTLRSTRTRLTSLRSDEASQQATVANLQSRVESARQELNALTASAASTGGMPSSAGDENPALTRARQQQWLIGRELRASRIARLETEIQTVPDRLVAAQLHLKLLSAQREQEEHFLSELLGMDSLKRIGDAEQLRDQVQQHLGMEPAPALPELVALHDEVAALADEYVDVVTRAETVAADVSEASARSAEVAGSFESTRQQLDIAALSDALGPVLMMQYRKLGSYEQPDSKLAGAVDMLSGTRLREFQVTRLLAAEIQYRETVYRAIEAGFPARSAERSTTIAEADRLLGDRSRLLDALNRSYVDLTAQIVDLEQAYRQQADAAAGFRKLIDRNLIWMKSHSPLRLGDLYSWPQATRSLLLAQHWQSMIDGMRERLREPPSGAVLSLVVVLVVWLYRTRLQQFLGELGLRRMGWRNYRFRMGGEAFVIHLLLALPLPLLLVVAGWLLAGVEPRDTPAQALAEACYQTAAFAYPLLLLLGTMGREGFAHAHLCWSTQHVQRVRRLLRVGLWVTLPLFFVAAAMQSMSVDPADQSYRVNDLLLTGTFFVFLALIVRAMRGMSGSAFYALGHSRLSHFGALMLLALLAALPLVFVLDVQGYHFTARALQLRVFLSAVVLVFAKMVLDAGLLALTLASQRSLASAQLGQDSTGDDGAAGQPRVKTDGFEQVDLEKMSAGAIALLRVLVVALAVLALSFVWRQFFAALSILDTVGLWSYAQMVNGTETVTTVSLFDASFALLVLGSSVVLASGLPALIGVIFYNLITERGVLYAMQALIRYSVILVGGLVSLHLLGFGWSKLQWMAAGLSVGIGFGLQEIFANFISGLIVLFERPVRIGDVVTLGDYSGTIQRIRMRATTITDFDNREIIVPNKVFVTERLINWTLSNPVVRLTIDVGVSCDSDPRQVSETLLEILRSEPRLMREPAPYVVFRDFGASTLDMRCFAHVENLSMGEQVQSELRMRINEVFHERGIELAYPQLDLHLRSVDPQARLSGQDFAVE